MRAVQARRVPRVAVLLVAAAVVTALATPVASPGTSTATAAEAPVATVDGDGTPLRPSPQLGSTADNGVRDGAVAVPAAPAAPTPAPSATAGHPLMSVDPRSTVDVGAGAVVPAVPGAPATGAGVVPLGSGSAPVVSGAGSISVRGGANDIPARVLTAYEQAATRLATDDPSCRITWQDIAGIGKVESDHARDGRVDANGVTTTPILGPVLDGGGFAAIRDTDGGVLDGNATWDRAVGPMQFIPSSWKAWGADADGDGTANPSDVDDAALGTGRYLCAGSRDLSTSAGLAQGIFSYNHSAAYVQLVVSWIRRYTDGGVVGVGQPVDLPVVPVGPPVRDPDPRGAPVPVVTTSPAPVPVVSPTTAPTPGPLPTPAPSAAPVPTTGPVPAPTAKPSPTQGPKPVPSPPSSPTPGPRPTPGPHPTQVPVPPPTVGPRPTPRPPAITPSPTSSPSTAPTPVPTSTPSPTPTTSASPTPTVSQTPGPTPSPTPSGTPTAGPTASPEPSPSPTSATPRTPGPSPTPSPGGSTTRPATDPAREPS